MSSARQTLIIITALSWRNLFRNKRRTLLTLLAIIVGVWSALSLSALARGLSKQAVDDAINSFIGHGQIHRPAYLEDPTVDESFVVPNDLLTQLQNNPLITHSTTRVKVPAVIVSERYSYGVTLIGINPKDEYGLSFLPDEIDKGQYFSSDNDEGIIVGDALLGEIETELGRRVVVMSTKKDGTLAEVGLRIVATFKASLEATEKGMVFVTKKAAQELLGLEQEVSLLSFRLKNQEDLDQTILRLKTVSGDLAVTPWTTLEPLFVAVTEMQGGFLRLWFFIVVLAICFGVINTLFMSIYERKREFYLIQSLGMKPRWIVSLVLIESFILLLAGTLLGIVVAVLTVIALQNGIDISQFSEGTEMIRVPPLVIPTIVIEDWWFASLLILLLGMVGSVYPAWKATKQSDTGS